MTDKIFKKKEWQVWADINQPLAGYFPLIDQYQGKGIYKAPNGDRCLVERNKEMFFITFPSYQSWLANRGW